MRRRGHQDHVPVSVGGQRLHEGVALVAPDGCSLVGSGTGVGLVDDDQLGAGADEVVSAAVGLDEVDRHDHVGVALEYRLVDGEAPFETRRGGRQHQLRVDVELVAQLHLPLLGQMRRAQHAQPLGVALGDQLRRDQRGLDGLAHPDVIRDEKPDRVQAQRHQQRHDLVRARVATQPRDAAERSGS